MYWSFFPGWVLILSLYVACEADDKRRGGGEGEGKERGRGGEGKAEDKVGMGGGELPNVPP